MFTLPKTASSIGRKNPPLDIWKYFLTAEDGRTAKCKICSKILKTTGRCTIGLYSHFYGVHRKNILENDNIKTPIESGFNVKNSEPAIKVIRNVINPAETPTSSVTTQSLLSVSQSAKSAKKRKIADYYKPADTETVVTRMIALDGVNFKSFTESKDLRRLFLCSGYNLPESTNSIYKMVVTKVDDAKEDIRRSIADMKKARYKFTLSLDEWTSKQKKRYLNCRLHCKALNTCKILGPVNITESTSSGAVYTSINDYLKTFNVSIQEDIVSLTTDGSSDMRKIGIHFAGHHQWCLAQGVQGAVISTLYRTTPEQEAIQEKTIDIQEYEMEQSDSSSESEDDSFFNSGEFEVGKPHMQAELRSHKQIIEKVRQVAKIIMGSSINASTLQAYIERDHYDEIQLVIDDQKSWTTMVDMIGSFLKKKNCILTLLSNIGSDIVFTEQEIECLCEVHLNLDLVRLVVLSLCRKDATLFTADTALRCMLIQLEELNTDFSLKLAANLRKRIKDRRLLVAGVLHYLHDFKSFKAFPDDDMIFLKPTSEQITELIVSLLKQLKFKCVTEDSMKNAIPSSSKKLDNATTVLIFDQEMELIIKNKGDQFVESAIFDLQALVLTERMMYEKRGDKGVCLTKAYEYLLTVMPTNIQPDRIFAVCGCVSTKVMSSHPDKILESLIFLRTYYEEQQRISREQEKSHQKNN